MVKIIQFIKTIMLTPLQDKKYNPFYSVYYLSAFSAIYNSNFWDIFEEIDDMCTHFAHFKPVFHFNHIKTNILFFVKYEV